MSRNVEVVLTPKEAFGEGTLMPALYRKIGADTGDVIVKPVKRSIDARGRKVVVRIQAELIDRGDAATSGSFEYRDVTKAAEVIIVGAGPAGLFAALRLIELGMRPIVLERGKDVQSRRRDLAGINKDHVVNPESNYCFGEGGAGTYSDGKLYTRSTKRGDVSRILRILVDHGAPEEILFDAHPHIGTNKLPKLVTALRETIERFGGIVRFDARVDDFLLEGTVMKGVLLHDGTAIKAESVILATGHSARDIFALLHRHRIKIESKAFALGLRIEHEQKLIDRIQYHCDTDRGPFLPAAPYSLVHQANIRGGQRGVFSFCMCPGGFIVPSATAPGEVVVNGMSPSRRDSRFANSGIVVTVEPGDFKAYAQAGPLAGVQFQAAIEHKACLVAGLRQTAPAQRLIDFIDRKVSTTLPDTSYQPGLMPVELREVLPGFIADALAQGLVAFGKKMKGYLTNDALLVGVESRTSSPVRIPRDPLTLEHTEVQGLFPCGEGAGYAGGIVSAALDGERCAEATVNKYVNRK